MCDDYDNYDPDYYDKEFRVAYPDVYGYDEYAQFTQLYFTLRSVTVGSYVVKGR